MISPAVPPNETERLEALKGFSILDTLPEQEFEEITLLASQICQTPVSTVTLIDADRQWFKSNRGLTDRQTARNLSFCAHAINTPGSLFMVPDSRKDVRFSDNPLVTGEPYVVFYAGVPLVTSDGFALGTICVIDHQPKELAPFQVDALRALSNQVMKLLELRKLNRMLEESRRQTEQRNGELKKFAYVVSHDIKAPLNNIISVSDILGTDHSSALDAEGREMIGFLRTSAQQLKNLVDGILSYYSSDTYLSRGTAAVTVSHVIREIVDLLDPGRQHAIRYSDDAVTVQTSEAALRQILMNLISNGIKYNTSPTVEIDITAEVTKHAFIISVKDNGIGIPAEQCETVFEPFVTLGVTDRFKNTGTGIGLSTVKKLVEQLGGTIRVVSGTGTGSEFIVTIKQ